MTPKEKAEELIAKFLPPVQNHFRLFDDAQISSKYRDNAKQCALICVEEILGLNIISPNLMTAIERENHEIFWLQVKTEIEKL